MDHVTPPNAPGSAQPAMTKQEKQSMNIESVKELRAALNFSADQGKNCAVITTQEAVRSALFEVEQLDGLNKKYFEELESLRSRIALLDWLKANVGNIDFNVIVPAKVMSTNPWIAVGENFETAVAKAKAELAAVVAQP